MIPNAADNLSFLVLWSIKQSRLTQGINHEVWWPTGRQSKTFSRDCSITKQKVRKNLIFVSFAYFSREICKRKMAKKIIFIYFCIQALGVRHTSAIIVPALIDIPTFLWLSLSIIQTRPIDLIPLEAWWTAGAMISRDCIDALGPRVTRLRQTTFIYVVTLRPISRKSSGTLTKKTNFSTSF
jgi:hypothetical protein